MVCHRHWGSILLLLAAVVTATASFSVPSTSTSTVTTAVRHQKNVRRHHSWTVAPKLSASASADASLEEEGDGDDSVPRGGAASSSVGTATIPNEVFNLIKGIVGAGVLSLPWGVAVFGNAPSALIPAVALIALIGGLSAYTFGLIGRICQRTGTSSYADAWDATVGKRWSPLIAFSCFIDCFAGNLSYSMILADTLKNLLNGAGLAATRTGCLLGVTGILLLPLCLLKNLSSLAPFSLVGIAGMLYTTAVMGIRWAGKQYQPGGAFFQDQLAAPVFGAAGASSAFTSPKALILTAMLANAYIAHFNAPKFLTELKNPTMGRYHQVIGWSFGASVLLYSLVTAFGFLTFGAASNGLILNNYSNLDQLASFSRMAVAVSIIASYPLLFTGVRDGLLDLFKVQPKNRTNQLLNKMTLIVLAVVTAMAYKLTDLGLVASVGGATFGTALTFIYPAIMFVKSSKKRNKEWWVAGSVGVLGVIMSIIGTILSLQGAA